MNYRGRDLDLRTPDRAQHAFGHSPVDMALPSDGPVLVDEAVLACCNHGYDLALAHRAREVRIEHLLNAMTRTDAAASVLAAYGIDVAGLRQDTAGLIAADDNIVAGSERTSPRRSQLLADVLNLAAERARSRGSTVLVSDILRSLLELNSEQPGLVMFKRNAPGWQPRAAGEPLRSEPLPPLPGGGYPVDPRYATAEPPREWVRVAAGQSTYYPGQQPGYFVPEPSPVSYYQADTPQAPATGTVTDQVQNSRLDQLERTIRDLSAELLAERRAASHGEVPPRPRSFGDERFEQETAGPTSVSALVGERLAGIERNVEAKFADIARGWSLLGERLQLLEQAVNATRAEPQMASGQFESIGGILSALSDRMQAMERQLSAKLGSSAGVNLEPVVERLSAIEQAQSLRASATNAALAPVVDRLAAIERLQANRPAAAPVDLHPVFDRIAALERSIGNRIGGAVDLAPVMERLQAIDGRVAEINRGTMGMADRVGLFERKLDAGGGSERATSQILERLRAIEDVVAAQRGQAAQAATSLTADVKALGQAIAANGISGERMQSLTQPLHERIGQISRLVETQRNDTTQTVAETGERISALEKVIQGFGQRTLDLHAAHGADLVELHNALVKLNGNQQTLASSMDQWRLENGSELSALLTRLDGVERANAKPLQMLESLQSNVQTLQRTTARREEQRSRFRHWLLGTDDWYGASWEQGERNGTARNGISPASQGGSANRDYKPRG